MIRPLHVPPSPLAASAAAYGCRRQAMASILLGAVVLAAGCAARTGEAAGSVAVRYTEASQTQPAPERTALSGSGSPAGDRLALSASGAGVARPADPTAAPTRRRITHLPDLPALADIPAAPVATASGPVVAPIVFKPKSESERPFAPSRWQHPIEPSAPLPESREAITERMGPQTAPPLWAAGPTEIGTRAETIVPAAIRVQALPGSIVYVSADQFGSFSTGRDRIAVRADDRGIAVVDIATGLDGGTYPFVAASPDCSGTVTFLVSAE
jgi:hypothetical protein